MVLPIILSGGSGTRLWPYSRSLYPKQFLPLVSEQTMLQETMSRLLKFDMSVGSPWIICNDNHRFMVAEQFRDIGVKPNKIILEPVGRNTAPAIALAALGLEGSDDEMMLVLPADHILNKLKQEV